MAAARLDGDHQVGHERPAGSAFFFRNQDEFNANTLFNNAFDLPKDDLSRNTYGGTLGGPVVKNKLFYFGSMGALPDAAAAPELRRADRADAQRRLHRGGGAYPTFRLFNPFTGGAGGRGRDEFANFTIPSTLISSMRGRCWTYYPMPNPTADLNSNQILDDYTRQAPVRGRSRQLRHQAHLAALGAHSIWGKFSMLDADVIDNFILGFDDGSFGDTRVYVGDRGPHLDARPDADPRRQLRREHPEPDRSPGRTSAPTTGSTSASPASTIPTTSARAACPPSTTATPSARTPNWMPLFRKERSYTFSSALTKVIPNHDLRLGVDIVHHRLNHGQAEFGNYGLKGGFSFSNNTTAPPATSLTAAGTTSPGSCSVCVVLRRRTSSPRR